MKRVAIIGGGISGLAAAHFLTTRRPGAFAVTLIESTHRLGGKIVTDRVDHFTIEGGPDSFVTEKPGCLKLCHEVGLGEQLIPSNEIQRKVYVLRHGRLVPFPSGFRLTVPTEYRPFLLTPLISPWGKLRMAMERFIPPRRETSDESLAQFIRRRLGSECLDRIAGPLMAGIFVSDPERMSMLGTFPRFPEMERKYGSLIRAAREGRRSPPPPNPQAAANAMFNSLKGGMQSLVAAIEKRLSADVRLKCSVRGLSRNAAGWTVHTDRGDVPADHVVCATSAACAAEWFRDLDPALADQLAALRYVSTTTVSLAYLRSDIPDTCSLDGFGVLIPKSENRDLIACTWSSVKFKHRAPEGTVLLRAFVGGPGSEDKALLPDEDLVAMVRVEYQRLFGIVNEPLLHRIYRWPQGNPQYDVGHLDRVADMEARAAALGGLWLVGSSYRGIGMPDCIAGAERAAQRILETADAA